MNAVCKGGADREVGDLNYGGTLRLTVRLNTGNPDDSLCGISTTCTPEELQMMRRQLTGKALTSWWLYLGTIPPKKIDPISASEYTECLKHHAETHQDEDCREQCRQEIAQLAALPPNTPIQLSIR